MMGYPNHAHQRTDEYYEIFNKKIKYRIGVFFTNDGVIFRVELLKLKFDYTITKRVSCSKIHKPKKYSFNLDNYKVTHNHEYSFHQPFIKTKSNEIIIYPNTIAPYLSPLYNITVKPKELFFYFSKNGNRIEIHY